MRKLEPDIQIKTADEIDVDGKQLIDNVAMTDNLWLHLTWAIRRRTGEDQRISDHLGVASAIETTG